jgi:hypothetical protein
MRAACLILAFLVGGCISAGPGNDSKPPAVVPLYSLDCSVPSGLDACIALTSKNDAPSKAEIDLIVNPKDAKNVIIGSKDMDRSASGCVWAIPQVTKDGGKSWTTVYIGGKKADRKPGDPLYGWGCITDPILAFDKDGWAYYGLQAYNAGTSSNAPPDPCVAPLGGGITSGSAFYLARSKDGGLTWDKIIPLHAGDGTMVFHDYPRMASSPKTGSTFVIWNQINNVGAPCSVGPTGRAGVGNVQPVLAGSRDRGETPIRPIYLTPANDPEAGNYAITGFTIDNNGKMYVALSTDKDAKVSNSWLVTSTSDGNTWTAPQKMFEYTRITPAAPGQRSHSPTTKFRTGEGVELSVDLGTGPHKGCLYGNTIDNATGHADVYSRRSCDQGKTWSAPVQVNHDMGRAWQFMTRNAVTTDGVVHVAYLTQAYDPGVRLLDAEYAYSEDAGEHWTTQRLTTKSFDGDKGIHQDGGPFFGDYIGLGASGNDVWVGFPDSVTGRAEVAAAHLQRSM